MFALRLTQQRESIEDQSIDRLRLLCGEHRTKDSASVMSNDVGTRATEYPERRGNHRGEKFEARPLGSRIRHAETGHVRCHDIETIRRQSGHHTFELGR